MTGDVLGSAGTDVASGITEGLAGPVSMAVASSLGTGNSTV